MNEFEKSEEKVRTVDRRRRMRLASLLHQMVRDQGSKRTAEVLGVNRKTVIRSQATGRLSGRMVEVLDRLQTELDEAAVERENEAVAALQKRVEVLDRGMQDVEGMRESVGILEREVRGLRGDVEALVEREGKRERDVARSLADLQGRLSDAWAGDVEAGTGAAPRAPGQH